MARMINREWLVRAAEGITREMEQRVGVRTTPLEKRIHAARLAGKRMRALMRMAETDTASVKFDREKSEIRDAARALSEVRDIDVIMRQVKRLKKHAPIGPSQRTIERRLRRGAPPKRTVEKRIDYLLSRVAASSQHIGERVSKRTELHLPTTLSETYRKLRKAVRAARDQRLLDPWHDVRKRAKDMEYQLDFLKVEDSSPVRRLKKRLTRFNRALGDFLDRTATLERLEQNRVASVVPVAWIHKLTVERNQLARKVRELSAPFATRKPRRMARRFLKAFRGTSPGA
jgi:CHAD domain-containing protein